MVTSTADSIHLKREIPMVLSTSKCALLPWNSHPSAGVTCLDPSLDFSKRKRRKSVVCPCFIFVVAVGARARVPLQIMSKYTFSDYMKMKQVNSAPALGFAPQRHSGHHLIAFAAAHARKSPSSTRHRATRPMTRSLEPPASVCGRRQLYNHQNHQCQAREL